MEGTSLRVDSSHGTIPAITLSAIRAVLALSYYSPGLARLKVPRTQQKRAISTDYDQVVGITIPYISLI